MFLFRTYIPMICKIWCGRHTCIDLIRDELRWFLHKFMNAVCFVMYNNTKITWVCSFGYKYCSICIIPAMRGYHFGEGVAADYITI
uniref:Uncharacterized protein n=1 Tax=Babesia bovis TaxID=5865 RepID=S6BLK1_BABBO|nr:hypothetical protein [Babesia bovis]